MLIPFKDEQIGSIGFRDDQDKRKKEGKEYLFFFFFWIITTLLQSFEILLNNGFFKFKTVLTFILTR